MRTFAVVLSNLRRLLIYRWKHFRVPEYVADALRNTVLVLLPLLLLFKTHQQAAVGMAVGVLLICLTDLPGNRKAKLLTAAQSLLINLTVSLIFSLCLPNAIYTGLAFVGLTFVLSMLSALGIRSTTAGAMGIALMVFMLGLHPQQPLIFSAYVLLGGIWFYAVSLLQTFLLPYRSLHQALREVLAATADFLEARASCYDPAASLDESYKRTIALHLRVAEKQEIVRSILLGDSYAMRDKGADVQKLLNISIAAIKLYEQVTATHYDYAVAQRRLDGTGVLPAAIQIIRLQADEIRWLSRVVPLKKKLPPLVKRKQYQELTDRLESFATQLPAPDAAMVNGLLINVRAVLHLLDDIRTAGTRPTEIENDQLGAFLSGVGRYKQQFMSQLHMASPVLRFALRLALLFAVGYTAVFLLIKHTYAYWLLLTILIVLRPRLAVTWQRNLERLGGTIAGVVIASVLLLITRSPWLILPVAAVALTGFFAWNRHYYSRSVGCVTVAVVLSLSAYHGQPFDILSARVGYTIAGCALAFAGTFIFPVWVNSRLDELARTAAQGNIKFLTAVVNAEEQTKVWLARKEAHLQLARLSEGLRHARVEPGKFDLQRLEGEQVLNYRINSIIISLFLSGRQYNDETSKMSTARTLEYLNAYVNHSPLNDITTPPVNDQTLLKGVALMEQLSRELYEVGKNIENHKQD